MYCADSFQQEMMQMVREPVIRGADKRGLTVHVHYTSANQIMLKM